jgi:hypothetical protein
MIWYPYAEHSAQAKVPGSAFDGSCGVDTEDILAIDFGSL